MRPVCVSCGKEMNCVLNGTVVYHPYEHARPDEKAQEVVNGVTIVNTDVLIEGGWKDGDIDFLVKGDKYECPKCGQQIVTGFGGKIVDYHEVPQEKMQEWVMLAKTQGRAVKIMRKE